MWGVPEVQLRYNYLCRVGLFSFTVSPLIHSSIIIPRIETIIIRLSLPFTGYPPSDLLIVSTLSPPHLDPITLPFPSTTNQVTVTFTELTAEVVYTYTIRVVLASNQSNDVASPVTIEFRLTTLGGMFNLLKFNRIHPYMQVVEENQHSQLQL